MKIYKMFNNCYCKEFCVICKKIFEADSIIIYESKNGYVCYDCIKENKIIINKKQEEMIKESNKELSENAEKIKRQE